ncbi:hypothetical protein GIB67_038239 [Kingdonia uniflora]|uniref:RING-CH-type domain-containing protein n=1 Tax=Kingdonia uniflora TaxID=39325 RepID=A0A7J7NSV5_9MAGN|nr:hypothetical protein GIB67_038239 [Kingdonia uniflora]
MVDQKIEEHQMMKSSDSSSSLVELSSKEITVGSEETPTEGETLTPLSTNKLSLEKVESCVIEVKCNDGVSTLIKESLENERVCRICHLSSDGVPAETNDLIKLGCGCKGELGAAHRHCAETWFKLKGNRYCEICGEAANNVTGTGDGNFMEEWNESGIGTTNSAETREGFWRGQPFCNFLMALLVLAFVLPWFFRVNML